MNTSPSTPPRPPRDNGRRPRETTTTTGMSPQKSKQKNHHGNNDGDVDHITRGLQAVTSPSKATDGDFVYTDDGSDNNIDFVHLDYEYGLSEFMTPGTDPNVEKDDVVGEGGEEDDDDDDNDEDFPEEYSYKRIDPHQISSMTPDDKPLPIIRKISSLLLTAM